MKSWGIKKRVLFLALMPASAIGFLLAFYFVSAGVRSLDQSLRERGTAIVRQLAPASEYGVFSGNGEILRRLAEGTRSEADVAAVTIANLQGVVLAASGKGAGSGQLPRDRETRDISVDEAAEVLRFSAPVLQSQIEVDDVGMASQGARGAVSRPKILGWVSVDMSSANTRAHQLKLMLNGLLITLLGLAGSALLALRMSRDVTEPVKRLASAVEGVGQGKLEVRLEETSAGELGTLEHGFNGMVAALETAQERMQERIDEATERLSYQATHDALTGLVNRREFEERLQRAVLDARGRACSHALCYVDLDQFKIVNDTCGHVAGDELLRQLTVLLKGKVRDSDTLARLGGDEFGLLLYDCTLEQARFVAELLRQTVKDFRFTWQDKYFVVGASVGLVPIDSDTEDISHVLSCADAACYAAKDAGRNRVHVYRGVESELLLRQGEMNWATRITRAINEDRFRLYYQTIQPLERNGAAGRHIELLLRLEGDNGEIIPPMAFLPAAERYRLMPAVDRWVVREALGMFSRRFPPQERDACPVCTINLSGASLCDDEFSDFIQRQFADFGVPHEHICFEISEAAAIRNRARAVGFIAQLRACGCRFSVDDFGSGLSSLGHFKTMPVDYLKIDGAFVRGLDDPADYAMVAAINHVGHVMGLKTIAESVEDEAMLVKLRELGVDFVQGYGIERPRPISDLFAGGSVVGGTASLA